MKENIQFCEWIKPQDKYIKINSDASLSKKGKGCGFIFRDQEGEVIIGEAMKLDNMNILEAELVAIYQASKRAKEMGLKFIWIESDSQAAVRFINGEYRWSWEYSDLLRNIMDVLSSFERWLVTHIWREGNRGADELAKMGAAGQDISFGKESVPTKIQRLAEEDKQGKKYKRMKKGCNSFLNAGEHCIRVY